MLNGLYIKRLMHLSVSIEEQSFIREKSSKQLYRLLTLKLLQTEIAQSTVPAVSIVINLDIINIKLKG